MEPYILITSYGKSISKSDIEIYSQKLINEEINVDLG